MTRLGSRTVNRYSEQFKATAVRLSQLPGVKVSDVATSLHIHALRALDTQTRRVWGPVSINVRRRKPRCEGCPFEIVILLGNSIMTAHAVSGFRRNFGTGKSLSFVRGRKLSE
jgi:hypothetical protein